MTDALNDSRARLEMNARGHKYDAQLERVCELWDTDRAAFDRLPQVLKAQHDIYRDFRDSYRRAVDAGVITDDRGPDAA